MRTKKEMKELEKRLDEVCEAVRNRFELNSDVDINWSYGMRRDPSEPAYRKMIPSGEDTIVIQLKPRT